MTAAPTGARRRTLIQPLIVVAVVALVTVRQAMVDLPAHSGTGPVAAWQRGVFATVTGAGGRHDSASAVTHEFVVVLVALTALALFLLSRRLGLGIPGAAAVVLLTGVIPAAAAARQMSYPGTLASGWLVLAALLTTFGIGATGRRRVVPAAGGLIALLAILTAPQAALLVLGLALALLGTLPLGAHRKVDRTAIQIAGVVIILDVGWLTVAGPWALAAGPVAPAAALGLAIVGLIAAAFAATLSPWLRPVALAALPLLLAATWQGRSQSTVVVLAVPVVVFLVVGLVEHAAASPWRIPRPAVLAVTAVLAVVAVVALTVLPVASTRSAQAQPPAARAAPAGPAPAVELGAWLAANVDPATTVTVDARLYDDLLLTGTPATRLRLADSSTPPPPDGLQAAALSTDADLPLVAVFGTGQNALAVRQAQSPASALAAAHGLRTRISFGNALAINPRLTLTAGAAEALRSGAVDLRLITVLAGASGLYMFAVDLPDGAGDLAVDPSHRRAVISGVRAVSAPTTDATGALSAYLMQQLPTYRPMSVTATGSTLTVSYAAPSPIDTP